MGYVRLGQAWRSRDRVLHPAGAVLAMSEADADELVVRRIATRAGDPSPSGRAASGTARGEGAPAGEGGEPTPPALTKTTDREGAPRRRYRRADLLAEDT